MRDSKRVEGEKRKHKGPEKTDVRGTRRIEERNYEIRSSGNEKPQEAVGRPDRPIVALYERRENRAGNWLLSKRGHVTCDPHRMPLTMGERANLQGSYAYTTRGGTVRFAEHKIEKSPGKRIDAMRWSRKMFLTRQLPRYPFTGPQDRICTNFMKSSGESF